jgi:hypothetical protein
MNFSTTIYTCIILTYLSWRTVWTCKVSWIIVLRFNYNCSFHANEFTPNMATKVSSFYNNYFVFVLKKRLEKPKR